jgi:hypothetical protein
MPIRKIYINPRRLETGELGAGSKPTVRKAPAKKLIANKQTIYATNYNPGLPTRRVSISGTAVVGDIGLETWSGVTAFLRQQFEKQGWNLHNFSLEEGSGVFSANVDINISADVSNKYTNQEHLDQAYRIFNAYTINYYVTTNRPFSNVRLNINGTEKPSYAAPKTSTISGTPNPESGGNSNGGNNQNPPPDNAFSLDKAIGDLSKGLFGSAGTSALLIAVVLGGIVILKR